MGFFTFVLCAYSSKVTQVIFLSHHKHLLPAVKATFGNAANIIEL